MKEPQLVGGQELEDARYSGQEEANGKGHCHYRRVTGSSLLVSTRRPSTQVRHDRSGTMGFEIQTMIGREHSQTRRRGELQEEGRESASANLVEMTVEMTSRGQVRCLGRH